MDHTCTINQKTPLPEAVYEVCIKDADGSETVHEVQVSSAELEKLGYAPDETNVRVVLEASFSFLLAREPKESILPTFRLSDIARYFPNYWESLAAAA